MTQMLLCGRDECMRNFGSEICRNVGPLKTEMKWKISIKRDLRETE